MEVMVLNPNHEGSSLITEDYGTDLGMVKHTLHVFATLVKENNDPKHVFVVGHSMGGECTSAVIEKWPEWAMKKIVAVAYTDGYPETVEDEAVREWAVSRSVNWIRSGEPVNTVLEDHRMSKARSAGTQDHPLTTFMAFPFIWEWFDQRAAEEYGAEPLVPTIVSLEAPANG
jgi:pimeloyl-ACP methyl ester carboxylesterase